MVLLKRRKGRSRFWLSDWKLFLFIYLTTFSLHHILFIMSTFCPSITKVCMNICYISNDNSSKLDVKFDILLQQFDQTFFLKEWLPHFTWNIFIKKGCNCNSSILNGNSLLIHPWVFAYCYGSLFGLFLKSYCPFWGRILCRDEHTNSIFYMGIATLGIFVSRWKNVVGKGSENLFLCQE